MRMMSWSRYHTRLWLSSCIVRRRHGDVVTAKAGTHNHKRLVTKGRHQIDRIRGMGPRVRGDDDGCV
jgi:hypothetical protein